MPWLYEHAGGEEAIHRLEDIFYASVLAEYCSCLCSAWDNLSTSIT